MTTFFNLIIAKHPVDGLKIALKTQTHPPAKSLTLVAASNAACSLAFGFSTPHDYGGALSLLHYNAHQITTEVLFENQRFPVIFPAGFNTGVAPYGELLDRLRPRLHDWDSVTIVLEYPRVELDLPPLSYQDRVTCFWEVRDLLTDSYIQNVHYLTERMLNENPQFQGLQLYVRDQPPENFEDRKKEIEIAASLSISTPLLVL